MTPAGLALFAAIVGVAVVLAVVWWSGNEHGYREAQRRRCWRCGVRQDLDPDDHR